MAMGMAMGFGFEDLGGLSLFCCRNHYPYCHFNKYIVSAVSIKISD